MSNLLMVNRQNFTLKMVSSRIIFFTINVKKSFICANIRTTVLCKSEYPLARISGASYIALAKLFARLLTHLSKTPRNLIYL